jgi:hypothetical protein
VNTLRIAPKIALIVLVAAGLATGCAKRRTIGPPAERPASVAPKVHDTKATDTREPYVVDEPISDSSS